MKNPRVVIAVPLAGPMIYWRTVAAILELEKPEACDLMVFQGALVDRARNHLVQKMLEHPMEATHLFFLDADIVPPPDALERLLRAGVPIISGIYRRRLPPHEPMAFKKDSRGHLRPISMKGSQTPMKGTKSPQSPEVDIVGGGCLLIQRKVFEKIGPPWFTSEWREEGHLSEDFSFCEKARKAGYKILVDWKVLPLHIEPIGIGTSTTGKASLISL